MKTLFFFRHGKSDWDSAAASDHERPINRRGRKAATSMGQFLTLVKQAPDSIVTSSAVRARTTAEVAKESGSWDTPMRVTRALYEASPFSVLEEIRAEARATERLLLVGHQPTWSELVSLFVGGGAVRFPTAALARIDLPIDDWRQAEYGHGELVWLVVPRLFTDGDLHL